MTVRPWHLLLPVCAVIYVVNWGLAVVLWLFGWYVSYLAWGGLRAVLFTDYGVEDARKEIDR